jgi:hypothetical protein
MSCCCAVSNPEIPSGFLIFEFAFILARIAESGRLDEAGTKHRRGDAEDDIRITILAAQRVSSR